MANKLIFKNFSADAIHGKVVLTTTFHNAGCADEYMLSRTEAAQLALDIIRACGMSGDISKMPIDIIEATQRYLESLKND